MSCTLEESFTILLSQLKLINNHPFSLLEMLEVKQKLYIFTGPDSLPGGVCSHDRAIYYYLHSIFQPELLPGIECQNLEACIDRQTGVFMGEKAQVKKSLHKSNRMSLCHSVCLYQKISPTAEPIWFSFTMWLPLDPVRFITILGNCTLNLPREIDPQPKMTLPPNFFFFLLITKVEIGGWVDVSPTKNAPRGLMGFIHYCYCILVGTKKHMQTMNQWGCAF